MLGARDRKGGKPTLAGKLTQTLRDQILSGALAPGEKINLVRLRDAHEVSGSSLREAVTRLVADGLMTAEEQRGYHVAPTSLDNLAEVTLLRMRLEPFALGMSIENGGLDWETETMAALYRLNRTERRPDDAQSVEAWETAHNAFHHALISRCEMPLLTQFLHVLMNMNDRYRRIFLKTGRSQRDVNEEHTAIAEAAVSRAADLAAKLLEAHIERTGATLRRLLTDRLPKEDAS